MNRYTKRSASNNFTRKELALDLTTAAQASSPSKRHKPASDLSTIAETTSLPSARLPQNTQESVAAPGDDILPNVDDSAAQNASTPAPQLGKRKRYETSVSFPTSLMI
jgi:hypothetical protein